jgi:hypothetical protein
MQYKYLKLLDGSPCTDVILRLNDDASLSSIPASEANSDWNTYQSWLAEDPENQPLPADE